MPSLSLSKWSRYEPSIPGNIELPEAERFFLEVAAGLSVVELQAVFAELKASSGDAGIAKALEPVVRLGSVPLVLNGAPVASVGEYVVTVAGQCGFPFLTELQNRIAHCNSYGGTREVFFGRPSGGTASTPGTSTEPGSVQTAAP